MRGKAVVALAVLSAIGVGVSMPSDATALRKAKPKERAALLKDRAEQLERQGYPQYGRCKTLGIIVRVSTVNSRYARLSFHNRVRDRNGCSVGDGFSVYRKTGKTYRHRGDTSWTGAPCHLAPRKVALDLVADVRRADLKRWGETEFNRCA